MNKSVAIEFRDIFITSVIPEFSESAGSFETKIGNPDGFPVPGHIYFDVMESRGEGPYYMPTISITIIMHSGTSQETALECVDAIVENFYSRGAGSLEGSQIEIDKYDSGDDFPVVIRLKIEKQVLITQRGRL